MSLFLYALRAARPELVSAGPTDAEAAVLARHHAYLEDLRAQGAVVLAGRTESADFATYGLVIVRAESEPEARRVVSADPAVAERVLRADLSPLRDVVLGDVRGDE